MKKAQTLILVVFFAFVCIVVGIFIGRMSMDSSSLFHSEITDKQDDVIIVEQNTDKIQSEIGKIPINTATSAQLQMLPNIGEVLATRIVEYRTENGPFVAIEDLMLVEGIGEKRLDELRQYITLGG